MTAHPESVSIWRRQLHGMLVIAKKNALLYYLKPPVLIFGVLFPVFFFIAFSQGRSIPAGRIVPGMVAMALWFTASAVGPMVTPWERRAKTYERLISTPLSLEAIIAGDVVSGFVFGAVFSVVPIVLGLALTGANVTNLLLLTVGIVLGALTFSALGELLAAPPVPNPSYIMMLSTLVRLPLLFISGVFVPVADMPFWARCLAPISPLTYAADLIRSGFGQTPYFPIWLDVIALLALTIVFFVLARHFHRQLRYKGL